jgi:hypothetical protein
MMSLTGNDQLQRYHECNQQQYDNTGQKHETTKTKNESV